MVASPDHEPIGAPRNNIDEFATGKSPLAGESGDCRGRGRSGAVQALARRSETSDGAGVSTVSCGAPELG